MWRLAGPVIVSNLSVPLLGAVDTAVMGHLPDPAYIGGVAVGALLFSYIYWGFGFLRMGTTGFIAQAYGAGDRVEMRATLARAALLATAIAAFVVAVQDPIRWTAFEILEASARVEGLAQRYYTIRIWGAPATLLSYVGIGWLFGTQRMVTALVLMVLTNGLNIGLDLLFVLELRWGIAGVAYATIIAEYTGALLGGAVILRLLHLREPGLGWDLSRILDRAKLVALVRVNADIFVRTLCLITGFAWFTAQGARMGDVVLAGNAVLMNFQMFVGYGLDGFAHAAEALVGSAVGARDRATLSAAVRRSTLWAGATAALFTLVYIVFGHGIIALLTSIEAVRASAGAYLIWAAVSPVVSVWSFQLDGIFIGATRTAEMRNGMILSLAALLIAGYALIPVWGNHGLWLGFLLFMAARGITLALWYPRIVRAVEA